MMRQLRVLLVEDSQDDMLLLLRELKLGGFEPLHERVETAEAMKNALAEQAWDIVIFDYRMPQFDAPGALQILRESGLDPLAILDTGDACHPSHRGRAALLRPPRAKLHLGPNAHGSPGSLDADPLL